MLRTKSFNIVAHYRSSDHRIVKVTFGTDGSIYVHFPSFSRDHGLVGTVTLSPGTLPTTLKLGESGRVTGHRVKYAHHVDGRAHFSQTGRVRSEVGRQAVPLSSQWAHLFTVQIQGLPEFAAPRQSDRTPKLTVDLKGDFQGLKIVCRRYPLDGMLTLDPTADNPKRMIEFPDGRRIGIRTLDPETDNPKWVDFPDGRRIEGLFVAPPEGIPLSENALLLTPEEWKNTDTEPCLLFLGGFDPLERGLDRSKETGFLALLYPCSDLYTLRERIGTIDL